MRFLHEGKGIYVTVDVVEMRPVIMVYSETNLELTEISIGFIDGTFELFKDFSKQGNLLRLHLNEKQLYKLRRVKFDQIVFVNSSLMLPCIQIINKEYFIIALKNYGYN